MVAGLPDFGLRQPRQPTWSFRGPSSPGWQIPMSDDCYHWSDTSEIKLGQCTSEFSVFIKSGHELYRFSLCQLFLFDSILGKTGKIKHTEKLAILQQLSHHTFPPIPLLFPNLSNPGIPFAPTPSISCVSMTSPTPTSDPFIFYISLSLPLSGLTLSSLILASFSCHILFAPHLFLSPPPPLPSMQ